MSDWSPRRAPLTTRYWNGLIDYEACRLFTATAPSNKPRTGEIFVDCLPVNSDASADQPPPPTLCVRCVPQPWEPLKWSANAAAVLEMHNQGVGTEVDRSSALPVSCVDWYGNARPLFIDGTVIALFGYELVEGAFSEGRLREVRRIDFQPSPSPDSR